ncbi:terminase large subunit domain-containing protein [Burkholderia cepacia]|uniref:phage terminase large subunit family protein n=1 Tax=Burkholderia TaxID=32008 RepID=UPI000ABE71FE|nr:terminase family protein [Burkholderia cepacia]
MKLREPGLPTAKAATPIQSEVEAIFLHPKQMEVFQSPHRFRVVVAGRRWGKTQLAKVSLIKYAKVARRLIWYVAPSYRMAKQIMWPDLIAALPRRWVKKINETTMSILLVNGTRIELKGADNPDSLRGVGVHFLVMDEVQDINPEAWSKVLRPTLASTGGHALFIGTPKSYNFLYDLYALGQNLENQMLGRWKSWQFPTITSPFIPKSEIEAAKADMGEKEFAQEFEASFETMSGRVYYPFDRKTHVGDYPFNPSLPIWVGQDFNIDPMSSCILQPQENGEVWIVNELSLKSSNTEEVCDELERLYWKLMGNITIFPDPAGGYRQHARGESDLDIFVQKGFKRIRYHKKHPPVADRVNAVNRMLRTADGKIRLRVDKRCKEVIRSLEQTIYKEGGREVDKDSGFDHMADAVGYPVQYMFPVREVQVMGVSL